MRKFAVILLLLTMPLIQGCAIGMLAAGVGYAISAGRKGTAKLMEAKAKYMEQFNTYKLGMEEINIKREKAGLKPKEIMTFEEWIEKQPLTPEELKFFKKHKAQTAKGLKEQEEAKKKEKAKKQ